MDHLDALKLIAHRVCVSEAERNEVQAALINAFGSDEQKAALLAGSPEFQAEQKRKREFDDAVNAELEKRSAAKAQADAISAAADAKVPA